MRCTRVVMVVGAMAMVGCRAAVGLGLIWRRGGCCVVVIIGCMM